MMTQDQPLKFSFTDINIFNQSCYIFLFKRKISMLGADEEAQRKVL